jgi:hypothetical protein
MASNFHQPPKKDSRSKSASSGAASSGRSGKAARDKRDGAGEKTPTIGRAAARKGAAKTIRAKGSNTQGSRTPKPVDGSRASAEAKPVASGKPSRSARKAESASAAQAARDARPRSGPSGGRGAARSSARKPAGTSKAMNAAAAAGNPGSYLNNCRKRALSVCTRRELGQQPRDVLVQLAIAHPVKTMRLGAIRQLTNGDSPRDVAALRLVERSVEAGPEVRAAASRGAEIVQHKVDDL